MRNAEFHKRPSWPIGFFRQRPSMVEMERLRLDHHHLLSKKGQLATVSSIVGDAETNVLLEPHTSDSPSSRESKTSQKPEVRELHDITTFYDLALRPGAQSA